jgi:hypothetical protein
MSFAQTYEQQTSAPKLEKMVHLHALHTYSLKWGIVISPQPAAKSKAILPTHTTTPHQLAPHVNTLLTAKKSHVHMLQHTCSKLSPLPLQSLLPLKSLLRPLSEISLLPEFSSENTAGDQISLQLIPNHCLRNSRRRR